MLNLKSTV